MPEAIFYLLKGDYRAIVTIVQVLGKCMLTGYVDP